MSQNSVPESLDQTLPVPVTAKARGNVAGATSAQGSAPAIIAISVGLAGASRNQPQAVLLFVGASIVVTLVYSIIAPDNNERTPSVVDVFFRRLPDVFAAFGCMLIAVGIVFAFPDEMALIPLIAFVFFAAIPVLTGMALTFPRITAVSYGVSLISLVVFVVLVACKG